MSYQSLQPFDNWQRDTRRNANIGYPWSWVNKNREVVMELSEFITANGDLGYNKFGRPK
jgi:hypothetical protein